MKWMKNEEEKRPTTGSSCMADDTGIIGLESSVTVLLVGIQL